MSATADDARVNRLYRWLTTIVILAAAIPIGILAFTQEPYRPEPSWEVGGDDRRKGCTNLWKELRRQHPGWDMPHIWERCLTDPTVRIVDGGLVLEKWWLR